MGMGKAIKADELKPCAICGKGVMHSGVPLFYRVSVEIMGVDASAVRQAHAMEQFFNGAVPIARVFMDPDIAKPVFDPVESVICQPCALEARPLALLLEQTG
jgi:hypothetical protein